MKPLARNKVVRKGKMPIPVVPPSTLMTVDATAHTLAAIEARLGEIAGRMGELVGRVETVLTLLPPRPPEPERHEPVPVVQP